MNRIQKLRLMNWGNVAYNKGLKHRALRALDSQQVARRLGLRYVFH